MNSNIDLQNIDISKLKLNTQGYDAIPFSDEHEAFIQQVAGFVDSATQSKLLTCDAECQKNEKEKLLYNDYLQAKQNSDNAPRILEDSKKNFYEFSKGDLWYQEKRESVEQNNANKLSNVLLDKFNANVNTVGILINKYKDQQLYNEHIDDLATTYKNKLQTLQTDSVKTQTDANVKNRKSYYENQKNGWIEYANHILTILYWIIVAIYMLIMLVLHKQYKNKKVWGVSIALISYPYIVQFVVRIVSSLF